MLSQTEKTRRWRAAHPEQWREIANKAAKRRILFKGKRVKLSASPRTGLCSNCGKEAERTRACRER